MSLVPDIPRFSQSAIHDSINELKLQRVLAPYEWSPAGFSNFSMTAPAGGKTTQRAAPSAMTMQIADMRDAAFGELDRYSRYVEGWDGYSGKVFSPKLLRLGRVFIEVIALCLEHVNAKPSAITTGPASDGSLDIEIQIDTRRLILTFYDDAREVEVYRVERDRETHQTIQLKGLALVNELVRFAS